MKKGRLTVAPAWGAAAGLLSAWVELLTAWKLAAPASFFVVPFHAAQATLAEMVIGAAAASVLPSASRRRRVVFALWTLIALQAVVWGSRAIVTGARLGTHANPGSVALALVTVAALAGVWLVLKKPAPNRAAAALGLLALPVLIALNVAVQTAMTDDAVFRRHYSRFEQPVSLAPTAPPAGARNVIVVVADTLRADALGCYTGGRATPNLNALAERGTRFDDVTAVSSWTRPTVSSLWTGRNPREHRMNALVGLLDESMTTVAEVFRASGYRTLAVVTNPILKAHFGFAQGFDRFDDRTVSVDAAFTMSGATPARLIGFPAAKTTVRADNAGQAVNRFLDALPADGPFFAWLHLFDPHAPYDPPEPFRSRYVKGAVPPFRFGYDGNDLALTEDAAALRAYRRLYLAEVAYMDRELGRLFVELVRRGYDKNTVLIFLADHGEQFREHGGLLHGYSLYQSEVRVPLIVAGPEVPARNVVRGAVSALDITGALFDLAGLPRPAGFAGSWNALLNPPEDPIVSEVDASLHGIDVALLALRVGGEKLIVDVAKDRRALFDLVSDPRETQDLIAARPDVAEALEGLLDEYEDRYPRPPRPSLDEASSDASSAALKSLGYLQ